MSDRIKLTVRKLETELLTIPPGASTTADSPVPQKVRDTIAHVLAAELRKKKQLA